MTMLKVNHHHASPMGISSRKHVDPFWSKVKCKCRISLAYRFSWQYLCTFSPRICLHQWSRLICSTMLNTLSYCTYRIINNIDTHHTRILLSCASSFPLCIIVWLIMIWIIPNSTYVLVLNKVFAETSMISGMWHKQMQLAQPELTANHFTRDIGAGTKRFTSWMEGCGRKCFIVCKGC